MSNTKCTTANNHAPVTLSSGPVPANLSARLLMANSLTFLYLDKTFSSSSLSKQIVQENSDLEYLFEQLESWAEKRYVERNTGMPSYGAPKELVDHARTLLVELRKKVFHAYKDIDGPAVPGYFRPSTNCWVEFSRRWTNSGIPRNIHNKL